MYHFFIFYFSLSLLYFCNLKNLSRICETMYQNASSKNRNQVDVLRQQIQKRLKFYNIAVWPLYEFYLYLKNEWRNTAFGISYS